MNSLFQKVMKNSLYNWILLIVIEYYENNNIQLNIPGLDKKSKIFNLSSAKSKNLNNKKRSQFDLLLIKEKEKNFLNNTKTLNIEDNHTENKNHNSYINININNKEIEYSNMLKLKLMDDDIYFFWRKRIIHKINFWRCKNFQRWTMFLYDFYNNSFK